MKHAFAVSYSIKSPEDEDCQELGFIDPHVSTLHEAVSLVTATRTNEVDGIAVHGSLTYYGCAVIVENGMEFKTGQFETRWLHATCSRSSAKRLLRTVLRRI